MMSGKRWGLCSTVFLSSGVFGYVPPISDKDGWEKNNERFI